MTWVVAGKHLFCSRCMSDVQVTFNYENGTTIYYDCLQKTHQICPGIVISFAGSVKLALNILYDITDNKNVCMKLRRELFCDPMEVAKKIVRLIKFLYNKHCTKIDNYVEFLLQIAPIGQYTEFGVWKLVAPSFTLIAPTDPFELLHIGSGQANEENIYLVKKYSTGYRFVETEPGSKPKLLIPTGKLLLQELFTHAKECQQAGVSKAMHICRLSHAQAFFVECPEDENTPFPQTAKTWNELRGVLHKKGVPLANCYAEA